MEGVVIPKQHCGAWLIGLVLVISGIGPLIAWSGTPGTESYTYDALGRLVTITSPDGTQSTYQYDAAGNRQAISTGVDVTPPSVPSGLTATAVSASQINLSWSGSTDTGGSGLRGYKITRNGSALVSTTSTATTYSDTGLVASTTYTYTVAAYDGAGNTSAASAPASATTPAIPIGTFLFVSGHHGARGSMGDPAVATVKNSGTGTITAISYSCSGGSWYKSGTSPTSLAPGASGTFTCQASMTGQQTVIFTFVGTGASNSPFSPPAF
jgi:YD repeat-containing protein